MHLVAATSTTTSPSCSSTYAETVDSLGSAPPPTTPADFYQGANNNNNGLFLPPPSHYYAAAPHFLFPPGGVSAGLPPLTPITPSVDPALGFKNGYIVPQTPNNMTMPQFFQVVQVLEILFNCPPSCSLPPPPPPSLRFFLLPLPCSRSLRYPSPVPCPPRFYRCMTPSPHPIAPILPCLSPLCIFILVTCPDLFYSFFRVSPRPDSSLPLFFFPYLKSSPQSLQFRHTFLSFRSVLYLTLLTLIPSFSPTLPRNSSLFPLSFHVLLSSPASSSLFFPTARPIFLPSLYCPLLPLSLSFSSGPPPVFLPHSFPSTSHSFPFPPPLNLLFFFPGSRMEKNPDPESGMNILDHIS